MKLTLKTLAASSIITALGTAGQALSANNASLPRAHGQGAISYVSGGIGQDEAAAFKHAAATFPLELLFVQKAGPKNEFLADVSVSVVNRSGTALLETTADGPFLLAELPDGKYTIEAEYLGVHKHRIVEIRSGTHQRAVFVWTPRDKG